jgi:LemA protein
MSASFPTRIFRSIVVAAAALSLASCGINSVPTAEEAAKAQWGAVESAYQRRADLIPNLVETVKAAAGSENQILTNVVDARARATSINITTNDLSNPEEFQKFNAAQNQLTQALGQLRTIVEAYPILKSQENFPDLMQALESAENQINTERMRYNEKAQAYNTEIRTFPSVMAAKVVYGSKPMEYFKADEGAKTAPKVDFGTMSKPAAPAGANDNTAAPASQAASN